MFSKQYIKTERSYGNLGEFLRDKVWAGENPASIANTLHIDPCTVRRWFDYYDIERKHNKPNRSKNLDDVSTDELEEKYIEMESLSKVGKHYEVSKETVRKILRTISEKRIRYSNYNNSSFRIKQADNFFNKVKKDPERITYSDFFETKREDGKTYSGLLGWYVKNYKCPPSEAIKIMEKEIRSQQKRQQLQ